MTLHAIPAKLPNGDWGARVFGTVSPGDSIRVTARSGKSWTTAVSRVLSSNGAESVVATAPRPKPAESDIDLSDLPAGMYAVPDGETRLKVRIAKPGKDSRWHGYVFVDDGAAYGRRRNYGRQAPGEKYRGDIQDALRAILRDPYAAATAYGKLTGQCCVCGRKLEDPESVANGIGPICAGKFG